MKNQPTSIADEAGFVLVVSLVLMILLGVLGVIAQHAGTMEMRIAANEKFYKMAFFEAEGGAALAIRLLEINLACGKGFSDKEKSAENDMGNETATDGFDEFILTRDFWLNQRAKKVFLPLTYEEMAAMPGEPAQQAIPDLIFPGHFSGQTNGTQTLITIAGETKLAAGNAVQMASGYEGIGRSAADRGAFLMYDITARHMGNGGSEATVHQQWRHVLGVEGDCKEL